MTCQGRAVLGQLCVTKIQRITLLKFSSSMEIVLVFYTCSEIHYKHCKPQNKLKHASQLTSDCYFAQYFKVSCANKIITTPTQPQLNSIVGFDTKMTLDHHHIHPPPPPPTTTNSMSLISQLFLTRFKPNFKERFARSTTT